MWWQVTARVRESEAGLIDMPRAHLPLLLQQKLHNLIKMETKFATFTCGVLYSIVHLLTMRRFARGRK